MNVKLGRSLLGLLVPILLLGDVLSPGARDTSQAKKPKVFDEKADGKKQVADAVAMATREHKRILLEFGANWCAWCVKLHQLFETDNSVSDELKADYVVALIDRNEDHNKDLMVKYGAEYNYGYPFLVVLDSDGKHLITQHSEDFEAGDHYNPPKVLSFLKEWAPKR